MKLPQTPSQTVGPFFAYGLAAEQYGYPFSQAIPGKHEEPGDKIVIEGQVIDGAGEPIMDALVELFHPGLELLRQGTGATSRAGFRFEAVKPKVGEAAAPCFTAVVFMRGLLSHVFTRIYFDDEEAANAADIVLAQVPAERRATLLARRISPGHYRFDIRMQGDLETVFFDI